jgi:alkylhydroperoxidase family enzyme
METPTYDLCDRLSHLRPESSSALAELNAEAWAATDPRMLELCRLRLGGIHGDPRPLDVRGERGRQMGIPEQLLEDIDIWQQSPAFGAAERAHLAFTEQFTMSVSSVTDDDVDALLQHLSELEVYSFIHALCVVELTERAERVGRSVLAPQAGWT